MLAIRPGGTGSICSCGVASSNTVSLAMLAAVLALKKSMRARRPFNSLRDMVIGFSLFCGAGGGRQPLLQRNARPRRLRGTRQAALGGNAGGVVGGQDGEDLAGGRVVDG